jgi:hypothetical protein
MILRSDAAPRRHLAMPRPPFPIQLSNSPFNRHHDEAIAPLPAVMPSEGGASSTPRLLRSIAAASGILDHPPSRVMTTEYASAISRHVSPEVLQIRLRLFEQRAQGMPGARCTRGLVCQELRIWRTRAYRAAETLRHPLRNGFTAYFVLSPVSGLCCHRHP